MSVGVDRAAVAEHVNNAEQARWSAPARSTSRPLRVPKKNLSPSQPLDRDGERVIMKVVAGAATPDSCDRLSGKFQSLLHSRIVAAVPSSCARVSPSKCLGCRPKSGSYIATQSPNRTLQA